MRIIVCEDNEMERLIIIKTLQEFGYCDILPFMNGRELYDYLHGRTADIILLDIDMPGMNGIEVAGHIRRMDLSIPIVFITAYDNFALRAFQVYANDYILKPMNVERLRKSLHRLAALRKKDRIIKLNYHHTILQLKEKEVIFIEKYQHNCYVHTIHNVYEVSMNLKEFEEVLDMNVFCRTHNGYIVNKDLIKQVIPVGNMSYSISFMYTDQKAMLSRGMRHKLMDKWVIE